MAKKKDYVVVTLECTEARGLGESPSRYTTFKNKKKHPDKMEQRKYNKNMRKHTLHREIK
jgi:large subunit ribosomal protein L33